jgi:hypothetical protein
VVKDFRAFSDARHSSDNRVKKLTVLDSRWSYQFSNTKLLIAKQYLFRTVPFPVFSRVDPVVTCSGFTAGRMEAVSDPFPHEATRYRFDAFTSKIITTQGSDPFNPCETWPLLKKSQGHVGKNFRYRNSCQ